MNRKKWLLVALKAVIAIAVVLGVGRTLLSGWEELRSSDLQIDLSWLVVAGLLYILSMAPAAMFWRSVMSAMGESPGRVLTFRAYCIGHLGKYVPGKALVIVLRAGLLRSQGIDTAVAAISVFFETLTMMAVGASIGAVVLALWRPHEPFYIVVAAAFVAAASLPTLPAVLSRLLQWTAVGKRYPATAAKIRSVDYATLLMGWASMCVAWALQGCSLWATVAALQGSSWVQLSDLVLYTGCVALAVVAGFASFIPGGLVVRDLILTALLAPQLGDNGEAKAIAAAVLLRLVWLVAEVGISVILYFAIGQRWTPAEDRTPVQAGH